VLPAAGYRGRRRAGTAQDSREGGRDALPTAPHSIRDCEGGTARSCAPERGIYGAGFQDSGCANTHGPSLRGFGIESPQDCSESLLIFDLGFSQLEEANGNITSLGLPICSAADLQTPGVGGRGERRGTASADASRTVTHSCAASRSEACALETERTDVMEWCWV